MRRLAANTVFSLRREPLYHKLQYSKVPKFDAAAAALGVIVGAFVVYLGLSSLGSASADLTDLTTLCWYSAVWLSIFRNVISLLRDGRISLISSVGVYCTLVYELIVGAYAALCQSLRY